MMAHEHDNTTAQK